MNELLTRCRHSSVLALMVLLSGCAFFSTSTNYPRFPEGEPDSPLTERIPEARELLAEELDHEPLQSAMMSDEWDYIRHDESGEITKRRFLAWFGWEEEPGACKVAAFSFYEENLGDDRWSNLRFGGQAWNRGGYIGGNIECTELMPAEPADHAGSTSGPPRGSTSGGRRRSD